MSAPLPAWAQPRRTILREAQYAHRQRVAKDARDAFLRRAAPLNADDLAYLRAVLSPGWRVAR